MFIIRNKDNKRSLIMNKKSAIKEMFSGNRGTFDQVKLSNDYKEAEKKMYAAVDVFLEKLNKEQRESFDKAYEHILDKNVEYATDHFVEGFKFGLLIGIECAKN